MVSSDKIKIYTKVVGLKRQPFLAEFGGYQCPVPMYYVFWLSQKTGGTRLLSLTATDDVGLRINYDLYSRFAINTGTRKETSLVILLAKLFDKSVVKTTYPKGTLSKDYSFTFELVRLTDFVATYKMLVNGEFAVYLNLAFKTVDKIGELVAQLDDTTSLIIRNAMSIIYDIYLHDYKTKNDLTAIGEKLLNYYAPFLYSNFRAEFFQ
jgi:hypothetical protein